MKLRDWMSDVLSRGDDIVISANNVAPGIEALRLILSHRGALLSITDAGVAGGGELRYAAVLSPEIFGLFSPIQKRKLVGPVPSWAQLIADVSILPSQDAERPFELSFGAGFKTSDSGVDPTLFQLDVLLAPVVFAGQVYGEDHEFSLNDGVFTVTAEDFRIEANSETGELIEFIFSDAEGKINFSIVIENGLFDRAVTEIIKMTASHHNFMDSHRPMNSWVGYLVEDLLELEFFAQYLFKDVPSEKRVRAAAVLRKIFDGQFLSPLDKLIARLAEDEGEDFYIPPDQPQTMEAATKSMYAGASAGVFKYINDFFPKGSWPWTAAREAVFVLGGKGEYTRAELDRIYNSEETGPLGYLTIAKLLTYIQHPATTAFAQKGMERLSAADFRKDYRLILQGESVLTESVVGMAQALRDLDDEDVDALAAILTPEAGEFFLRSVELIREGKDKPVGEALAPALDEYWNKALKQQVEAKLRQFARESQRPNPR